jgi:hypothetical protein
MLPKGPPYSDPRSVRGRLPRSLSQQICRPHARPTSRRRKVMSTSLVRTWFLDPLTGPLAPTGHAPFIPDDPAVESIDLSATGSNWSVPELRTLLRDGLGPRGGCCVDPLPSIPLPRFPSSRHSPIRAGAEHIAQAGELCVALSALAHKAGLLVRRISRLSLAPVSGRLRRSEPRSLARVGASTRMSSMNRT